MYRNFIEVALGFIVFIISVVLVISVFVGKKVDKNGCYEISSVFIDANGVREGTQVKISGVVVGNVLDVFLNDKLEVVVNLCINKNIFVPVDSIVYVDSESPFSERYLNIDIGSDSNVLEEGGVLKETYPAFSFNDLVKKFLGKFAK